MNEQAPILIGGGGHARSLVAMAPAHWKPTRYVDPEQNMALTWLGDDSTFLSDDRYAEAPLLITYVAPPACSMSVRRRIIDRYRHRSFATLIADDAVVEPDTVIGKGTMIFHRVVVNTGAYVGDHVILNTGAIIEHDTVVGENTFVGPGAIVAGSVTIGRDVYIGAGAILRNGISIAAGTIIGMGAIVTKSITTPGLYAGNPAKPL